MKNKTKSVLLLSILYVVSLTFGAPAPLPGFDFSTLDRILSPVLQRRIALNIRVDLNAPFTQPQRQAIAEAVNILDEMVNSRSFYDDIQQLSLGGQVFTTNGRTRDLQGYRDDLITFPNLTPLAVLNHLASDKANPDPFSVTAYKHWNIFSSEVAKTTEGVLKFNKRRFSPRMVDLIGTLFHERLHHEGFSHEFFPSAQRSARIPYYFGDLMVHLLSGLTDVDARTIWSYPTEAQGFRWK